MAFYFLIFIRFLCTDWLAFYALFFHSFFFERILVPVIIKRPRVSLWCKRLKNTSETTLWIINCPYWQYWPIGTFSNPNGLTVMSGKNSEAPWLFCPIMNWPSYSLVQHWVFNHLFSSIYWSLQMHTNVVDCWYYLFEWGDRRTIDIYFKLS